MLPNILDRQPTKKEVSLSAFSFLFAEIVRQCRNNVATTDEWEERLAELGYQVGIRALDLAVTRDRNPKRETNLVNMLAFVQTNCWKMLFGKVLLTQCALWCIAPLEIFCSKQGLVLLLDFSCSLCPCCCW